MNFGYGCYLSRLSQTIHASFEKIVGGLVTFDDGHTCQIEGIGIVCIKLSDGMLSELKDVRCTSVEKF